MYIGIACFAQDVTLTFTGRDANNQYCQLNRVLITNLTRGWQETIYWPDTTLMMQNGTGIYDVETMCTPSLQLSPNNPNPFSGTTDVNLTVTDAGAVTLEITDVNGHIVGTHRVRPQCGVHQFRVTLSAAGNYVMTARQNGKTSSIKMVNKGNGDTDGIKYLGIVRANDYSPQQPKSGTRGNTTHPFQFGDQMEYVGYATINGTEEESQRISQAQGASQIFTLVFAVGQNQSAIVATAPATNITQTSATVGGYVISDGGSAVTERGVCYDTTAAPTISDHCLPTGAGVGAFTNDLTGLTAHTTYYVRAYAVNAVGVAYGDTVRFITMAAPADGEPCPGTPTVTDVDSNVYNTVQIGQQCWMRENLKTTRYADNTPISLGTGTEPNTSSTIAYRYYPSNNSGYVTTYGYLYNWAASMRGASSSESNPSGVQGICPTGWHLPSDAEWTQLTDYVSSRSEYCCGGNIESIGKALAIDNYSWQSEVGACIVGWDPTTNNATGFSARPAGNYTGSYNTFGMFAFFWTATQKDGAHAWNRDIGYNYPGIYTGDPIKGCGLSVRCIRN